MVLSPLMLALWLHPSFDAFGVAVEANEAAEGDAFIARWLVGWSWAESRWRPGVVDASGTCCGAMQTNKRWSGGRCVRDRRESFDVAVRIYQLALERCGTRKGALANFASGKCDVALDLVEARCKLIGC
jgi:hypothetical protein